MRVLAAVAGRPCPFPCSFPCPTTEPEMPADALFQPFTFKGLHLPNRIVMAPMTRSMSPGGVSTPEMAGYYARRAGAQVGLIVSEGVGVERAVSVNSPNIPRFHGEAS